MCESTYQTELMKYCELEQVYMMKNKKRLEAKKNPLLSVEEITTAINDCNLAKQMWEKQEKVVLITLHKNNNYYTAYKNFRYYIETKY